MEKKLNNEGINEKSIKTKKYKNYCCLLCSEIPEILNFNEIENKILLKCHNHGEKIVDIHDYLNSISQKSDKYNDKKENKCIKHNIPFELYCKTCEMNLCLKCNNENNSHLNHIKYKNEDVYPNINEITLITNRINIFINEKNKLLKKLEILNDKIILYETILHSIENEKNNFIKNINVKHIIYGKEINLPKIFKDTPNIPIPKINKEILSKIINNKTLELMKEKKTLSLLYKNSGNEFLFSLFNNHLNDIIKENNFQMLEDISFLDANIIKNLQIINLKGNKIKSINFLSHQNLNNLEFLCLNDNEIKDISPLKDLNFPLIKQLYLSKNKITSIKVFEEIKMRNLQILWLSDNNIKSIEPFKKSYLQKLEKLGLNKNKIENIGVFKQIKCPLLIELYINDNDINYEIKENKEVILYLEEKIEDFYY